MSTPWERFCTEYANKNVLIFGLGRQGGGAKVANTFAQAGAQVTVTDTLTQKDLQESIQQLLPSIALQLGEPTPNIEAFELLIKNPAVPFSHPSIQSARHRGIPVLSETALAVQFLRDRCIGITGTRGKTTTTTLIGQLLQQAGYEVQVGGNIPQAPALSLLPQLSEQGWAVLELSSFQLESFGALHVSPHIAIITNIYPDHLNRYDSVEAYADTKAEILRYQLPGDIAILGGPLEWQERLKSKLPSEVTLHQIRSEEIASLAARFQTRLPGAHNQENIAVVATVADALHIPESTLQNTLDTFTGVPYRLESIATKNGVEFINDTTSTTPIALEKALQAYPARSFILVTGGATKHLPLEENLLAVLEQQPAVIITIPGTGTSELLTQMQESERSFPPHIAAENLEQAVQEAGKQASQLQVPRVLFSPGFTSFESYKNEFDRGDHFNRLVREQM